MALTSNYEAVFIFSVANGEEAVTELCEKFKSLIAANGTVEAVDEWGKRRLAYEINDETEGYYVLVKFSADHDFPAELERIAGITDGVMRVLVIKK